jgi:hypothetical protein
MRTREHGRRHGRGASAAALLIALGCRPAASEPPICPAMVSAGGAPEARTLPADVWFSLLVQRFDRVTMDVEDPPRECSGQPIAVTWPDALQDDPRARARRMERRARTDADVSVAELASGELLVWARLDDLDNGDAVGPVALVRWIARGVEVRAVGSAQAPARGVKLRLEPLGAAQVLVLESEACRGEDGRDCQREAQLLPLVGPRFVGAHLFEADRDVGPARFLLDDRREEPLADGWVRRHELHRRLEFDGVQVHVHETIRASDCDPRTPNAPCEERLTASDRRSLRARDDGFQTTPSAWVR